MGLDCNENGNASPFRHRSLRIWQDALALDLAVREFVRSFPPEERFALTAQLMRCADSVPSNIAEGSARHTVADFIHFLYVARGSLAELDTQLTIADRLGHLSYTHQMQGDVADLGRSISAFIRHLRDTASAVAR